MCHIIIEISNGKVMKVVANNPQAHIVVINNDEASIKVFGFCVSKQYVDEYDHIAKDMKKTNE